MESPDVIELYTAMISALRNGDTAHARGCASDLLDHFNAGGEWPHIMGKRQAIVVAECKLILKDKTPAFMDALAEG